MVARAARRWSASSRDVAHAKVINSEAEYDVTCVVAPETGCQRNGTITMGGQNINELVVGKAARLWEAVHSASDLDVDIAVVK